MPPLTILAIVALAVILMLIASRVEGLALFAPKRTDRMRGSAQRFCLDQCKMPDGRCPLTVGNLEPEDCPLWKFVAAGLPTDMRLNRLEPVGPGASSHDSAGTMR